LKFVFVLFPSFSSTVLPLRKIKKFNMSYQNLLVTEEGPFLTVTINREKALNALNQQTMSDLAQFFGEDLPQRSDVRGVILTGAGDRAFVAGADIKEFTSLEGEGGANMAQRGQDVFFLIERSQVPVVAAIQGFALGGGCELAMACHLRIAGEKARFGQPEVNLGIIPGYGGTQRLIQYIGKTKATELMMTGDMLGAEDALRLGLVNYVVAPGEEIAKAKELLQKIATKGPRAIAKVIEAVNAYFQYDVDGFANEVSGFGDVTKTEDFKEGAQAFVEKRAANFTGK
jgi:enoyl-CoA hydratase